MDAQPNHTASLTLLYTFAIVLLCLLLAALSKVHDSLRHARQLIEDLESRSRAATRLLRAAEHRDTESRRQGSRISTQSFPARRSQLNSQRGAYAGSIGATGANSTPLATRERYRTQGGRVTNGVSRSAQGREATVVSTPGFEEVEDDFEEAFGGGVAL